MLGRRLSHYRILEALGAGGMGQVFRARDERLGREVALKILASGLLKDPGARRRFKKESQALCRVSHPHVATLFDSARVDGVDFLVMELVPGLTLKERIRQGWLGEKEVVRLASQLAMGLQAAHDLGVVHRDIKPSNLALTADGLLKILDFGLARLVPHRTTDDDAQTMTAAGVVAGSPPYMPPEQLLGRAVDARCDLYAVGAVMYEMVTRRRVFGELKGAELTDAILNRPARLPAEIGGRFSARLEVVILKLLDKEPRLRYQSAGELLVDLERLEPTLDAMPPVRSPASLLRSPGRRWLGIVGAVLLLGLLVAQWLPIADERSAPGEGAPSGRRGVVTVRPLTSAPGSELHPALSPSGRRLAYVAGGSGEGNTEVYVQDVGSHQSASITTSGLPECCVAWMPDERDLAFVRLTDDKGVVIGVGAGGGIEEPLAELTPWFGTSLSISPDGLTLAYPDRRTPDGPFSVVLLSLETLQTRPLTTPPSGVIGDAFPAFSPDGEWVAFSRISTGQPQVADVYAVRTAGGEPRRLTSLGQFIGDVNWAPDGRSVLFWSNHSDDVTRMWRIALEGGDPVFHWGTGDPLTPRHFTNAEAMISRVSGSFRFSVARRGGLMALTLSTYDTDIWEITIGERSREDPDGPLVTSTQTDESPQFSPDGTRIAFASLRSGNPQIWICDRAATHCAPLLAASREDGTPRWSPDGREIAFDARPEGRSDIFVIDVETRLTRALTDHEAEDVVPSWSRDGGSVYFASRRTGSWQVFKVPASGGDARQMTKSGGFAAFESPTGETLLYTRFDSAGLWAMPLSGGTETEVLSEPRCWGHWAVGPDAVYVAASPSGQPPSLLRLDLGSGQTTHVAAIPRRLPCGESALAISSDGDHLLYAGIRETSDLVLIDDQVDTVPDAWPRNRSGRQ